MQQAEVPSGTVHRLLGVLPLFFFVVHASAHWPDGWPHMLWMCIIGNLLIAMGIFLDWPLSIRVGVLWLVLGLGLWLWFVVMREGTSLPSVFAHVGGLVVGLVAVSHVGVDRMTWLYASVWYVVVQHLCRMFTPAEPNVNIAHRVYDGLEDVFAAYGMFWAASTMLAAFGLWVIGLGLHKVWPARPAISSPTVSNRTR